MNAVVSQDIRGVLISVSGGKLMLPNATVAEVITYSNPEPVANAPKWLLGRVRWRGWGLPIVSYSQMVGWPDEAAALGAKVAVLKGVGGYAKMPYFAIVTQGFPRLITIAESELSERSARDAWLPEGIFSEATFHNDDCVVPDLASIEAKITAALQGAGAMAAS